MLGSNKLALWISTGVFAVATVFSNGYILAASLRTTARARARARRSPSESIVAALAAANVLHQLVCYFWMSMDEVDVKCRIVPLSYTVLLLLVFSLKFTITWDTSFLTFYYSVRLAAAPAGGASRTRALTLKHATAAVLLVPLMGAATCVPMLAVFHADNRTRLNGDCGVLVPDTRPGKIYEVAYLLLADVLPGAVVATCCASICVRLYVHLRRMRAGADGARRPKPGAQLRVIQMSLSIVVLFSLFLAVDLYVNYQIAVNGENAISLTFFFTSMYTTGVAVVLVYGKKTLWKELLRDYHLLADGYPCASPVRKGPRAQDQTQRSGAERGPTGEGGEGRGEK